MVWILILPFANFPLDVQGIETVARMQVRIPGDADRRSGLMAITIPG